MAKGLPRIPSWLIWVGTAVFAALMAVLVIWVLPLVLTRHPHVVDVNDRYTAINNTRTGLVAAIVAAGAIGGLAYTARTYRLSQQGQRLNQQEHALREQGQITDRYAKAIEQLDDSKSIEVRLGGIYALERLMRDSSRDQPTIVEVLGAYIREHLRAGATGSSAGSVKVLENGEEVEYPSLATDVEAAIAVLRRSTPVEDDLRFDLHGVYLTRTFLAGIQLEGFDLTRAHLEGAVLSYARLNRASLIGINFEGASLIGTNFEGAWLQFATLTDADLSDADLSDADLKGANLVGARLDGANLDHANLDRANLRGADLRGVLGLVQAQLGMAIVDEFTRPPEGLVLPVRGEGPVHGER